MPGQETIPDRVVIPFLLVQLQLAHYPNLEINKKAGVLVVEHFLSNEPFADTSV